MRIVDEINRELQFIDELSLSRSDNGEKQSSDWDIRCELSSTAPLLSEEIFLMSGF